MRIDFVVWSSFMLPLVALPTLIIGGRQPPVENVTGFFVRVGKRQSARVSRHKIAIEVGQ